MADKDFLVVFTSNNARIVHGVPQSAFDKAQKVSVSPDLSKVKGVPPHYWKLDGAEVLPMTPAEMVTRDADHSANGVDNEINRKLEAHNMLAQLKAKFQAAKPYLVGAAAGALALLVLRFFL